MSTPDPHAEGQNPPPAGYPGATQPAPPSYPAPPAYGSPAAPPAGYAPAYPTQGYGYAPPAKTNTMAIVSLALSIAGMVIIPFIGSLVGAILGHVALGQIKKSGEQGRGLALAGVIVGWVGLALSLVGVVAFIAWFGWIMSMSPTYPA